MTPPKNPKPDAAVYLQSALSVNPVYAAESLLAARAKFLGVANSGEEANEYELFEKRHALTESVESLRSEFWTLDLPTLKSRFQQLDCQQFPDLQLAYERLLAAAKVRNRFPKIVQHPDCDPQLLDRLKQVVVAPPREAGRLKQSFALRLATHDSLRKSCQRMVRMIDQEFPEVYEIEPEWFDLLLDARKSKAVGKKLEDDSPGVFQTVFSSMPIWGWGAAYVIFLIIKAAVRMQRMNGD